jgi:hypothetical protein
MQLLATPALAAAVETEKLMAGVGLTSKTALILVGIAIAASVFGNWFASFVLAKRFATLGRAALTMIAEILGVFAFGVAIVLFAVFLGAAEARPELMGLAFIGGFILYIVVIIAIPMQIYEIGILRSIGFLLLSALVAGVVSNIAKSAIVGPIRTDKLPTSVEQFTALVKANYRSGEAPDPDLQQRQAALQKRFKQLEIRRKYLPPNDHKEFAAYERDRTEYERDLEQFKADSGQ